MRWTGSLLCSMPLALLMMPALTGGTMHAAFAHHEAPAVCSETVPVHVSLAADVVPLLGKEGTVTATVTVDYELADITLEIELPADGKVLDTPRAPLGRLNAAARVSRSFRVKFDTAGNKLVRAVVKAEERPGVVWSAVEYLPLNIGAAQSRVGFEGESLVGATGERAPASGTIIAPPPSDLVGSAAPPDIATPAPASADEPTPSGLLTLSGTWSFEDRSGGFGKWKDTVCELLRGGDSAHLAWTYTNWNGDFTFPAVTNPGAAGCYVQVGTWTDYGSGNKLSVISLGGDEWDNRYRWNSPVVVYSDGAQSMGDRYPLGDNKKAVWIQDDCVKAFWVPPDRTGRHVAEWSPTSAHGTHYHPGGNIHLMAGDADDTPDTVLHEMGHSVMYNIYGNYMPPFPNCNPHYLMGSSSTGCAWTEGWAQTWHMWTTNDPIRSYPGGGGINLETATWGDGYDQGDTVEGRVAGAIWDITDGVNDGTDTYDGSWDDVWDVMWNVNRDTFAEFWASWKSRGHAKHGPVASIYQCTIDYNTWPTFGGLPNVTTPEDTPDNNAIDLYVYASDPESSDGELVYTITGNTDPSCGVSIDGLDFIDINPAANWNGTSTVTVSCTDGIRTRTDSFVVTVTAVNDPPTITGLPDRSTNEDTPYNNAIDLWAYASDPETSDSGLTYTITGNTNANCGVSIDAGDYIDINPVANWNGTSTVTVRATDPSGLWDEDLFVITVNPVNDAPVISGLPDRAMNEDATWDNAIDLWVYTSDVETADSGLTYTVTGNTNASCGASIDSNRYVDINPAANWNGTSDVTVRATDPSGLWDEDTFRITVNPINDPPTLAGLPDQLLAKNTSRNNAIDLWVHASDVETSDTNLVYTITGNTDANCGVSIDTGDYVDINPTAGWTGVSNVTIRATDEGGLWDEDTFKIVVAQPFDTIAEARANPNGTWVSVTDKVTTARWPEYFYVEEVNRTSGIKVSYRDGPGVGVYVTVAGPLATSFAERQINAEYVYASMTAPLIGPLGMPNRSLGGGSPDPYTVAVPNGGVGTYDVGLLVRTTGEVIDVAGAGVFAIADGSSTVDNYTGQPSLYVRADGMAYSPPVGSYVTITGISGATTLSGQPLRVLRPRSESDIVVRKLDVAYVHDTNLTDAQSFKALLDANSLPTTLVKLAAVTTTDLSRYQAIVVGNDTGTWADAAKVNAVLAPGTPIIGVGTGGARFLDAVSSPDLYLGWLHSWSGSGTHGIVHGGDIYSYPNSIPYSPGDNIYLYYSPGVSYQALHDPTGTTNRILREYDDQTHYVLASEYDRFYQWGFTGAPSAMTGWGRQLFVNLLFSTAR